MELLPLELLSLELPLPDSEVVALVELPEPLLLLVLLPLSELSLVLLPLSELSLVLLLLELLLPSSDVLGMSDLELGTP